MDNNYGGVIWTNHALDRLRERGISQGDALHTFNNPQQSRFATSRGGWIYYRSYGSNRIEIVAKKNEKGEWLIISVWSKALFHHQGKASQRNENIFVRMIKGFIDGLMR